MTKFIKTLLSIAGGCLVLGIILSIVGLCLGGRLTSIRVGWDNGPRVYYTDAFRHVPGRRLRRSLRP